MSLNIGDISARGSQQQVGSLLGDNSRKDEVQRLAQSVAAEHFGVGQQQQQPQNGNSAFVDQAKISSEAIEELSRSGKDIQRTDQLVNALKESFQAKSGQGNQNGNAQNGDGTNPVNGEGGGQPQKRLEKKRTTHWEPIAQENQIHAEGREVIGKITIKEEVREVQGVGESAKSSNQGAGSRGAGGDSGGGTSGSSPQNGNSGAVSSVGGAGSGSSNGNGVQNIPVPQGKDSQKSQDEEGKNDKQTAAVAQNLKSAGLQAAPGMEEGAQNNEVGEKSKDFDVRSPATGASQTLTIRGAGDLGEGEQTLGTYKKLDDSPALRYASLHARGEGRDRTAERYAQAAQQMGDRPEQVQQNVEQLKKATADG